MSSRWGKMGRAVAKALKSVSAPHPTAAAAAQRPGTDRSRWTGKWRMRNARTSASVDASSGATRFGSGRRRGGGAPSRRVSCQSTRTSTGASAASSIESGHPGNRRARTVVAASSQRPASSAPDQSSVWAAIQVASAASMCTPAAAADTRMIAARPAGRGAQSAAPYQTDRADETRDRSGRHGSSPQQPTPGPAAPTRPGVIGGGGGGRGLGRVLGAPATPSAGTSAGSGGGCRRARPGRRQREAPKAGGDGPPAPPAPSRAAHAAPTSAGGGGTPAPARSPPAPSSRVACALPTMLASEASRRHVTRGGGGGGARPTRPRGQWGWGGRRVSLPGPPRCAGSNIKTTTGPPQAGRPVKSDNNRNVAPPGAPPAARNPVNQTPRAVPPHRRAPSLATAEGPHHAVREVDAMADSGTNRRFTGTSPVRVARPLAMTNDTHTRAARRWG
ncbi:hypothetical protein BU14_0386s0012, partial [Porphyra umbilicalis]